MERRRRASSFGDAAGDPVKWAHVLLLLMLGEGTFGLSAFAAGRVAYGGEILISATAEDRERWRRSLTQCRLFRPNAGAPDAVEAELASDLGRWSGNQLSLSLVSGAAFHDGSPIEAKDVVRSLERSRTQSGALSSLFSELVFRRVGALEVVVETPKGMSAGTLRRLLAHPIASVRHGAHGCGAFRRSATTELEERYDAHVRHPRGRPWLDGVRLVQVDSRDTAVQSLVFEEADVTTWPSHRYRKDAQRVARAWSTVFAVPGVRWRSEAHRAVRRRFAALIQQRSYARYLDAPSRRAQTTLPPHLTRVKEAGAIRGGAVTLSELVVAYPAGRADLAELAQVVLGRLGKEVRGSVSLRAIEGLDLSRASSSDTPWDVALVDFAWEALDAPQAVALLSRAASKAPPTTDALHRARVAPWLRALRANAELIAVVHVERATYHRLGWHIAEGSGRSGGLGWSWRVP